MHVTADVALPLLVARGALDGPLLVVSAGVHGDEYEGTRAIYEFFETLDPMVMTGTLLAAPVVNPPAHRACSRTSPVDGKDLARVFPGDPEGTLSQRIAWMFAHEAIARAAFFLDLHSGGVRYSMPLMAGYDAADPRGHAAAEALGLPVIWGHPAIPEGRTISFARARGIPFLYTEARGGARIVLYTEARGGARIAPEDLAALQGALRNLMIHLGMLSDSPDRAPIVLRLLGAGNSDEGIKASQQGFLMLETGLLDRVDAGQRLGRLVDLQGRRLEEYHAPHRGVIGLVREMPVVESGDTLFLLAREE